MIDLKRNSSGFEISFKGKTFFSHSISTPLVKIGFGKARFRSRNGEFKIREKLKEEIALTSHHIERKSDKRVLIHFEKENYKLKLEILEEKGLLKVLPRCDNGNINRFWIKISATETEAIFGCGEQYSELNLRGKVLPLWVEEQGLGRGDPPITGDWYTTYYPQPTYISSEDYFFHSESSSYAKFDFSHQNYHEFHLWNIPQTLIIGKYQSPLETISNLSQYLGRQPKLHDWVFDGVWLGIQGGKDVVNQKLQKCFQKGVKVGAVWCQDWQGVRIQGPNKRLRWNWEYDEELYPELPALIKELNGMGVKFLGYINPFLTIGENQHELASKNGYLVKNGEGDDYEIKTDSGPTSLIDLSNPDAYKWLKQIIQENMLEVGLDGWMADYGEYLPTDALLHSKEDAKAYHNKYPTVWAKLNYEAVKEKIKSTDVVFFTRSGYSKTSKYTTLIWAGDQLVNWSIHDGLASVIPAGISAGICGIGYYHFDIGGFHALDNIKRDKEVFMRWTEFAAFTMVMRTHESIRPSQNWQFDSDEETLKFFARMSRIHVHLKPYLEHLSEEYQEKGYPPMRACFLHYENDPVLYDLRYQYLLGRDLLIAPIIKPNTESWQVYLPGDVWIHIWSDMEFQSGWHEIDAPIGNPPVFFRKKSKFSQLFRQVKQIN